MKFLKKCGFVLLITSSTAAFSKAALAGNNGGQIAYDAFDLIINKVKNASAAINAGSKCVKIVSLIKSALDACKEVDANDLVDRDRVKACSILRAAKKHAKECDLVIAKNKLTQAENMFEAIKIRDVNLQQIK